MGVDCCIIAAPSPTTTTTARRPKRKTHWCVRPLCQHVLHAGACCCAATRTSVYCPSSSGFGVGAVDDGELPWTVAKNTARRHFAAVGWTSYMSYLHERNNNHNHHHQNKNNKAAKN